MDNNETREEVTVQPAQFQEQTVNVPAEYKPISMWGYFGYEILFSIPCVGFILLCVFSFGGTQNVNLKNFARSYFCFFILAAVLILLLTVIFGVSLGALGAAGGLDGLNEATSATSTVSPY